MRNEDQARELLWRRIYDAINEYTAGTDEPGPGLCVQIAATLLTGVYRNSPVDCRGELRQALWAALSERWGQIDRDEA